jgi:23S rRNA pseudouridine955/2504/2580 synthase
MLRTLGPDDAGRRLDRLIRKLLPDTPLGEVYKLFRTGKVRVNGKRVKDQDYRGEPGDELELFGVNDSASPQPGADVVSALPHVDIPAIALFENDDILIVNKPSGLLTHGEESLEESVRAYLFSRQPASLAFRPGPLHRLDRNTSGCLCFSKSLRGAQLGAQAFLERDIDKYYLGICEGRLLAEERWEDRLTRDEGSLVTRPDPEGKLALTGARPLVSNDRATLALFKLETGLTHQIRAQAALHGHPLWGDRKYGSKKDGLYYLHCREMGFPEGLRSVFPASVKAELPPRFARKAEGLFGLIPDFEKAKGPGGL